MLDRIEEIGKEAAAAIARASGTAELEELRVRYLGRKAELTTILRGIAELPQDERGEVGAAANQVRKQLEDHLGERSAELDSVELEERLASDRVDVTLPGAPARPAGHLHLITRTTRQIEDVMIGLGYRVVEGPEIEHDYYNFTALNHPPGHPARMLQDTFYVQSHPDVLLRTHTSPVQIRAMEAQAPPIFVIVPGKVYRRDSDATHSPMFHQVEGLYVAEKVTLADLKYDLMTFLKRFFERDMEVMFRPSYFPFVEPGADVHIRWEGGRWLEVLGCGMVHPNEFKAVGLDPEKYTGYAFGMGVERMAMLRYGVDDLRQFFANDLRFLEAFQ
jgi:phenylalanyl-tRNA synthetase alpha chain